MGRGGARNGSGRKPLPPKEKRVSLSIRVTQDTKDLIPLLRAKDISLGREVDRLVYYLSKLGEN